jgi:hypothetical protein
VASATGVSVGELAFDVHVTVIRMGQVPVTRFVGASEAIVSIGGSLQLLPVGRASTAVGSFV